MGDEDGELEGGQNMWNLEGHCQNITASEQSNVMISHF